MPHKCSRLTNVVPPVASAELLELLDGVLGQVDLLQVRDDALGRDGLGDDRVATNLSPCDQDLSRRGADPVGSIEVSLCTEQIPNDAVRALNLLLSNRLDFLVLEQLGLANVVVAERRVSGDVDVVFLVVLDDVLDRQQRVALELVDGGSNAGLLDQDIDLMKRSISQANRMRFVDTHSRLRSKSWKHRST